jgi:PAT family beta-lactamase induction signal transducer AmpG
MTSPSAADQSVQPPPAPHLGRSTPPPWLFLLLAMPGGVFTGGITSMVLSFVLRREGHAMSGIANEVALLGVPPILYFLWSPLADFWISRKHWYLLAACLTAAGTAAAFSFPDLSSPIPVALLFAATCCGMICSASYGGMAAALVPEEQKSRVSSMIQVGNLGGGALGSGGLLLLAEHSSHAMLGMVGAAAVLLPALAVLAVDAPPPQRAGAHNGPGAQLATMGREFKTTFLRWSALPSLLLLMSPLASGGAIGLLPGLATDYRVSGTEVAWLNGMAGALLTAAGALLLALVPKRADPRLTYVYFGLINAASMGILCLGPTNRTTYLAGTILYLVSVGAGYANFTAVVLQVIGKAGASACSRYSIAVGLGNAPVAYMAAVDGLGSKWWGTRGLSGIDMTVSTMFGVLYLVGYWIWLKPGWTAHLAALPEPELAPSAD